MAAVNHVTPVLAGLGMVEPRCADPADAAEARELMRLAVAAAAADAGTDRLLGRVGLVAMPKGQWHYGNPGRFLADAFGMPAQTVIAVVGVLQQTLIADACRRIAIGELDAALVVGAEARYRVLRSRILGVDAPESADDGEPDEVLRPTADLVLQSETSGGLGVMPVGYYATIESALCAALGRDSEAHRDAVAALYARFTEVAAVNPHAWKRDVLPADFIRNPSAKNPMLAFPYTKLHNSSWNVDQATALLLCSAAVAREVGVDPARCVFPVVSAESNHALPISVRPDLAACPGVRVAGERAFAHIGASPADVDVCDVYTCFPAAVQLHARELGLDDGRDLTATGAMPFAGGPFNSYVLQATGRVVELLRAGDGELGLVSSVSGLLTKHGVGLWSTKQPTAPYAALDVTPEVAALEQPLDLAADADANRDVTVVGHTVIYGEEAPRAVAVVEFDDRRRFVAQTRNADAVTAFETANWCGRSVTLRAGELAIG